MPWIRSAHSQSTQWASKKFKHWLPCYMPNSNQAWARDLTVKVTILIPRTKQAAACTKIYAPSQIPAPCKLWGVFITIRPFSIPYIPSRKALSVPCFPELRVTSSLGTCTREKLSSHRKVSHSVPGAGGITISCCGLARQVASGTVPSHLQ